MTNDTSLWYMDGDFLKHRNAPEEDTRLTHYILENDPYDINRAILISRIYQDQPTATAMQIYMLHSADNNDDARITILRGLLAEQLRPAEASTASLKAQLAQARDDLDIAQKTIHEINEWRKEIADGAFDLTLMYNQQTDELRQVTDALNERTLELNNMRQFYCNRDAELDRMREYVRQVTEERTAIKTKMQEDEDYHKEQIALYKDKSDRLAQSLEIAMKSHNEAWDKCAEMERYYLATRDRRDYWKAKYDALREVMARAAECMNTLDEDV